MVGGVEAHEASSSPHTSSSFTYAGVQCKNTMRSSFIHSFIGEAATGLAKGLWWTYEG